MMVSTYRTDVVAIRGPKHTLLSVFAQIKGCRDEGGASMTRRQFHGDSYNDWHREEVDHVIILFHIWFDGFWRAEGLWKSLCSLLDGMEVTYGRLATCRSISCGWSPRLPSELFVRDQLLIRVLR